MDHNGTITAPPTRDMVHANSSSFSSLSSSSSSLSSSSSASSLLNGSSISGLSSSAARDRELQIVVPGSFTAIIFFSVLLRCYVVMYLFADEFIQYRFVFFKIIQKTDKTLSIFPIFL